MRRAPRLELGWGMSMHRRFLGRGAGRGGEGAGLVAGAGVDVSEVRGVGRDVGDEAGEG